MKSGFLIFTFLLISGITSAQQIYKFPSPINEERAAVAKISPALLPDSSVMLIKFKDKKFTCVRYEYKSGSWIQSPNLLTNQINSIVSSSNYKAFRFSPDYNRITVVTDDRGSSGLNSVSIKNTVYYESVKVGNYWQPLDEILFTSLVNNNFLDKSFVPAYSQDLNEIFYLQDDIIKSISYGQKDTLNKQYKTSISGLSGIKDVIPIGSNRFLVGGTNSSGYSIILSELENETINGKLFLKHYNTVADISVTPFKDWFIMNISGNIQLVKFPDVVSPDFNISANNNSRISIPQENSMFVKPDGEYYALIIGNSDYYDDNLDLAEPSKDALQLSSLLETKYSFQPQNIYVLENATRSDVFAKLYSLRSLLTKKDNLLIFYAGHGYWDSSVKQGYWWPVDAVTNNPSNWLSNSDLREQIRALDTGHILLISDACFAGGIFKARGPGDIREASIDIQLLYRSPSRRAITSGFMSSVPDESVFFKYLIKHLEENQEPFISSGELFTKIRKSVLSNSLNVPQEGVILNTGDEGGDFIFIKKK